MPHLGSNQNPLQYRSGEQHELGISRVYLLDVLRLRLDYPELKRMVREQTALWCAKNVLIEDKASGTQLCQELIHEGMALHPASPAEAGQDRAHAHGHEGTYIDGFAGPQQPDKREMWARVDLDLREQLGGTCRTIKNGEMLLIAVCFMHSLRWYKHPL